MRRFVALMVAAVNVHAAATLDSLFDTEGAAWKLSANEFMEAHREDGFRWLSAGHEGVRSAQKGLTFHQMKVVEAVVRFEQDRITQVALSLYNRGDEGDMATGKFQDFMASVDEKLTTWTGMKGVRLPSQERSNVAAVQRKSWIQEPYRVDLVWSLSEKSRQQGIDTIRPEYARLEITRFDPTQDPRKSILAGLGGAPRLISATELKARVKHEPNGDVLIPSVPMVDQGHKGYCAAAVAERVLRYYGHDVDQHEIAQLANTTASGGTNPEQMLAALRRIGGELKIDVTVLQNFDGRDFMKMIDEYNHAAKRASLTQYPLLEKGADYSVVHNPVAVYSELDPELLKEVRLKHEAKMTDFKSSVTKFVNNGEPLAWAVLVGKIQETPVVRGFGGHMRLIIGYNDRTKEILYTDTWGAGHELKRLSLADAWTMTMGLYLLQPREVRF